MARILVIEDDRLLRELLFLHLTERGHEVTLASEAIEGIRALLAEQFDLVVSDLNMPYMDGLDLLQAIRGDERSSHIPVVVLTGRTDDDTWSEAMRRGATRLVTKPVRADEMVIEVERALAEGVRRRPA